MTITKSKAPESHKRRVAVISRSEYAGAEDNSLDTLVYRPERLVRTYPDVDHLDGRMFKPGEKDTNGRETVWAETPEEAMQAVADGKRVLATVETIHTITGWGYDQFAEEGYGLHG